MLNSFLIPFVSIFLAELLDKSQLTILLLGTKTKKHLLLLLGVIGAFVIVDGTAILVGSTISNLIPENIIKIVSGAFFILFGIYALKNNDSEKQKDAQLRSPLFSGFSLVFLSEWGDKTQIASAVFAAKYNPFIVFFAVILALFLLSVIALKASNFIIKKISKRVVSLISGVVFIILGVIFLFT